MGGERRVGGKGEGRKGRIESGEGNRGMVRVEGSMGEKGRVEEKVRGKEGRMGERK